MSDLRFEELPDRDNWTWRRIGETLVVAARNWWARAFGRGRAWDEGRDTALANAAMVAHDMGRPDIRHAINRLMPKDSPYRPRDCDEPDPTPTPGAQ